MRSYQLLTKANFSIGDQAPAAVSLPHTWNALDGQDGGNNYLRVTSTLSKRTSPSSVDCTGITKTTATRC